MLHAQFFSKHTVQIGKRDANSIIKLKYAPRVGPVRSKIVNCAILLNVSSMPEVGVGSLTVKRFQEDTDPAPIFTMEMSLKYLQLLL